MGKRMKKLALLLSVSMLVNSIDTAAIVGAADMTEVMEDSEMAMEETVEEQESGEIPVYEELSVEEARAKYAAKYVEEVAGAVNAAKAGMVDDIIDPAKTRAMLISALEMLASKRDSNPPKKHGNLPM